MKMLRNLYICLFFIKTHSIPFIKLKEKSIVKKVNNILTKDFFTKENDDQYQSLIKENIIEIIQQAEEYYGLPKNILLSIGFIESNHYPYIIRFNHKVYKFKFMNQAEEFLRGVESHHKKHNIDIGFMQINNQHSSHFSNFTQILDPKENIWFAAKLLAHNITHTRSIKRAISMYNSGKAYDSCLYLDKVLKHWSKSQGGMGLNIESEIYKVRKCYSLGKYSQSKQTGGFIFMNNKDNFNLKAEIKNYTNHSFQEISVKNIPFSISKK